MWKWLSDCLVGPHSCSLLQNSRLQRQDGGSGEDRRRGGGVSYHSAQQFSTGMLTHILAQTTTCIHKWPIRNHFDQDFFFMFFFFMLHTSGNGEKMQVKKLHQWSPGKNHYMNKNRDSRLFSHTIPCHMLKWFNCGLIVLLRPLIILEISDTEWMNKSNVKDTNNVKKKQQQKNSY